LQQGNLQLGGIILYMRADLALISKASLQHGVLQCCMTSNVTPDVPWYSPEMVARFLQCPSLSPVHGEHNPVNLDPMLAATKVPSAARLNV